VVLSFKQFWNTLISQVHLRACRKYFRRTAQSHIKVIFRLCEARAWNWFENNPASGLKSGLWSQVALSSSCLIIAEGLGKCISFSLLL
jgi:hypothetical protein